MRDIAIDLHNTTITKENIMRRETYERLEKIVTARKGYVGTRELLAQGITNRQIAAFVAEGLLEKVCHGCYWLQNAGLQKPADYKAIEVCMSDLNAVICADSACFYLGLIEVEPSVLSITTSRGDRSTIKMNFPITRHYCLNSKFVVDRSTITTDFGNYNIYDVERSVCDSIRFRKDIDTYIFELIIDTYRERCKREEQQEKRILEYAKRLRMMNQAKKYF